jgi:hypothetical protein
MRDARAGPAHLRAVRPGSAAASWPAREILVRGRAFGGGVSTPRPRRAAIAGTRLSPPCRTSIPDGVIDSGSWSNLIILINSLSARVVRYILPARVRDVTPAGLTGGLPVRGGHIQPAGADLPWPVLVLVIHIWPVAP